jgi:phosphatidylserine/phosphatidylglycerophosphate/cardiolipin synthase-like enzyme
MKPFDHAWQLVAAMLLVLSCSALAFEVPERSPAMPAAVHAATGTIEVAFSPWDDGEALILRTLKEAHHDIYVQAFLFTSRGLASALIEAQERGIRVQVLADAQNVERGSQIPRLARSGIPVALETRYASAHNKLVILDPEQASCAVITGSYNFTHSARVKNAENLLVLRGDADLARSYLANWRRHRADAVPYARSELKAGPAKSSERKRLPFPWESDARPRRDFLELQ